MILNDRRESCLLRNIHILFVVANDKMVQPLSFSESKTNCANSILDHKIIDFRSVICDNRFTGKSYIKEIYDMK